MVAVVIGAAAVITLTGLATLETLPIRQPDAAYTDRVAAWRALATPAHPDTR